MRRCLLAALGLTLTPPALATTCAPAPFDDAVRRAELVVQVEVRRHLAVNRSDPPRPTQMEVRVLETYSGKLSGAVIRVLGDRGMDPFPFITAFPVGTRWVVALEKRDWYARQPLPGNLYAPVGCVQQGLLVSGLIAFGVMGNGLNIARQATSIRLTELPTWVRSLRARP